MISSPVLESRFPGLIGAYDRGELQAPGKATRGGATAGESLGLDFMRLGQVTVPGLSWAFQTILGRSTVVDSAVTRAVCKAVARGKQSEGLKENRFLVRMWRASSSSRSLTRRTASQYLPELGESRPNQLSWRGFCGTGRTHDRDVLAFAYFEVDAVERPHLHPRPFHRLWRDIRS